VGGRPTVGEKKGRAFSMGMEGGVGGGTGVREKTPPPRAQVPPQPPTKKRGDWSQNHPPNFKGLLNVPPPGFLQVPAPPKPSVSPPPKQKPGKTVPRNFFSTFVPGGGGGGKKQTKQRTVCPGLPQRKKPGCFVGGDLRGAVRGGGGHRRRGHPEMVGGFGPHKRHPHPTPHPPPPKKPQIGGFPPPPNL